VVRENTLNPIDLNPIDETHRLVPFELHYGDAFPDARMSFRLAGVETGPVVAVLGGISAHRVVAGQGEGWWPEMVGPGLGVDTRQYRVLGIDYLGGKGGSSTPSAGGRFPPISSYDQANALSHIVRHLGLKSLHAIVGASYGGMVALCFAERYASLVNHIVVLSAADRGQVLSTAWRSVQRQIVREAIARGDVSQPHRVCAQVRRPADPRRGSLPFPDRGLPVCARR
jgi:homoserine O-acetyltransferase